MLGIYTAYGHVFKLQLYDAINFRSRKREGSRDSLKKLHRKVKIWKAINLPWLDFGADHCHFT